MHRDERATKDETQHEPAPDAGRIAHAMAAIRAWTSASPWLWIAKKAALYGFGFVALALVGSGRVLAWPGAHVSPTASTSAAPAGSSAASASASATASANASATPDSEAGDAKDAGADDADAGSALTPDGKVALNRATEADLRRLPGVGPTRARAILALRGRLGGHFKKVEDLLRVKGLGRKSLARLRPLVVVD